MIAAGTDVPRRRSTGNDMDTYAADVAELVKALDLKNAIHIGHSTGGGEVTRYVAQHGKGRVAKAVLISSVPPQLLKSEKIPMAFRWRCSTNFVMAPPTIARSSTRTSPCPFTVSIVRRENLARHSGQLVAAGNDGRDQGSI